MTLRNSEKPSQRDAPCSLLPYDCTSSTTSSVHGHAASKEGGSSPDTRRESSDLKHFEVSVTFRAHLALVVFTMMESPPFVSETSKVCPVLAVLDLKVSENGVGEEP